MTATDKQGARMSKAEWGSDVIAEVLRELDVEYMAINPGATFRGVHDSVVNYYSEIPSPRSSSATMKQIAVAIAHGYGKAAGKPMAAYVHNVVGLLHATMAIYNAWTNRSSVLVLGATGPMAADNRRPWIDWIHTASVQGQRRPRLREVGRPTCKHRRSDRLSHSRLPDHDQPPPGPRLRLL